MDQKLFRKVLAEALGTASLLGAVTGSGIMAAKLSGANVGLALLANALATGAALYVLILIYAPISGAHFNPAVTLVMRLKSALSTSDAVAYVIAQTVGGIVGVIAAHAMFELPLLQASGTVRTGAGQWLAEGIAAFGLILTILGTARFSVDKVAAAVGLYIVSAYWFTASTSFANPAVTIARAFTDTFAGIMPANVPTFIVMQIVGALAGLQVARLLFREDGAD